MKINYRDFKTKQQLSQWVETTNLSINDIIIAYDSEKFLWIVWF